MQRSQILAKLITIISQHVKRDDLKIEEESTARDVPGWDSLAHINIVLSVEREFDIHLRTSELAKLQNVADLIAVIEDRGQFSHSDEVT